MLKFNRLLWKRSFMESPVAEYQIVILSSVFSGKASLIIVSICWYLECNCLRQTVKMCICHFWNVSEVLPIFIFQLASNKCKMAIILWLFELFGPHTKQNNTYETGVYIGNLNRNIEKNKKYIGNLYLHDICWNYQREP